MKETNLFFKDKVSEERRADLKKATKIIARIKPKRGHTLFEVDMVNGQIRKAEFEKRTIELKDASGKTSKSSKKVFHKPGCVYVSCLNKKNIPKILKRDFGLDINLNDKK